VDGYVNDQGVLGWDQSRTHNLDYVQPGMLLLFLYEQTGLVKYKLAAATVQEVEAAVQEAHKVREKGTPEEVKAAGERLERASHKAAEELYKSTGPGAPPGGPPPPAEEKKKEDVVDAEFKQV
jgi:hypothetical protein